MTVDISHLIATLVAVVGGWTTAILYASNSHNAAKKALEQITELRIEINHVREKHDALDNRIVERLSAIEKGIARMEGVLSNKINGMTLK